MPGMAWKRAFTTTFMPSAREATRMGRSARNVRSARSAERFPPPMPIQPTSPIKTMQKSKMFHEFLRYAVLPLANPVVMIFSTISTLNSTTKILSSMSSASLRPPSWSRLGESTARMMDDTQIRTMMINSNFLCCTISAHTLRMGFSGEKQNSAFPSSLIFFLRTSEVICARPMPPAAVRGTLIPSPLDPLRIEFVPHVLLEFPSGPCLKC
mmetsp:Transcript_32066/g.53881  ORF Transcript_32066/g.53881 Transcript_32066/m.53881 type:complete len:211 (-) Transcript_32066:3062-3694(-)